MLLALEPRPVMLELSMALPQSRVVDGIRAPTLTGARVLHAYGVPDDPLRLLVLLAEHLVTLLGNADGAGPCFDPRAEWRAKREALSGLLDRLRQRHGAVFVVLVDLDALLPSSESGWDDPLTHRMQVEMFDLV